MNLIEYLARAPRRSHVVLGCLLVLALGYIDYQTGPQISFSIFYFLPIAYITCSVGRTAGIILSILSAVAWLVADVMWKIPYSEALIPYWNALTRLFAFLIVVYLLSAMMRIKAGLERKVQERTAALADELAVRTKVEEEIRASHEQMRHLAASLESAREEERKSVAREIHDELGQALTGLGIDLSWLVSTSKRDEIRTRVEGMKETIESMLKAVQRISAQLRPAVLDHLGLVAAMEWKTQEFQKRTRVRATFTSNVEDVHLDENRTTAIFRIYLEALTNITRHARAASLEVRLNQNNGNLELKVTDDGRGITVQEIQSPRSIGLLGMKERALLLGGKVDIRGSPGVGTTLMLTMPLNGIVENHDQGAHR